MIYLAGQAGGTGDGTAVTEREARAERWGRLPAPLRPDTVLDMLLRQQAPPPSPFGMPGMMGLGGMPPFGGMMGGSMGSFPFGGPPMMNGWEYQAYQQMLIMQQRAAAERARWDALP
jgi:hypothetical protein